MAKLLLAGLAACVGAAVGLPAFLPANAAAARAAPQMASSQQLPTIGVSLAVGRIVRMNGAAPLFPDVPPGGFPHATYTAGNCTAWVAYNRRVPPYLGDGWQWLASAAAAGMPTTSQPALGAIAVYGRSPAYDPVHGHVAIVVGLGTGGFTVSEMNFLGLGIVDERGSPWPDSHVEGFIV